jgi:hypothetical protein
VVVVVIVAAPGQVSFPRLHTLSIHRENEESIPREYFSGLLRVYFWSLGCILEARRPNMAKKKSASVPVVEAKAETSKIRETILSLKGSPEWSQWLGDLSTKLRSTKAGIIDRALAELAERNGFREPPER